MKYKVEVVSEGDLVKADMIRDKHPKEAITQVIDDADLKEEDKEIEVRVTNKSGSFWIYKMKFMKKADQWKGKLVKSLKNFFDSIEVDEIFEEGKSAIFMAKKKAEKGAEEFQREVEDGIEEARENDSNENNIESPGNSETIKNKD